MAVSWDEAKHPRRPDGEFAHSPGGGDGKAVRTSLASWEPDLAELLQMQRDGKETDRRDQVLERIAAIQGFDAVPASGPLDAGREVLYRGFGDRYGGNADTYIQQFLHGGYYGSTGLRANGMYVTTDKGAAGQYGSMLEMQLAPDARTATLRDMEGRVEKLPDGPVKEIVNDDPGKLAAMLGFDALVSGTHRIILNRGALRVAPREAASKASRMHGAFVARTREMCRAAGLHLIR